MTSSGLVVSGGGTGPLEVLDTGNGRTEIVTEAEWEYAARGPESLKYRWGESFDGTRLNYCDVNCGIVAWSDEMVDDGYFDTAPVGSYSAGASWCGALDMARNVWEWVADWYAKDYYETSPYRNPAGPRSGQTLVTCGGSWAFDLGSASGAPGAVAPLQMMLTTTRASAARSRLTKDIPMVCPRMLCQQDD